MFAANILNSFASVELGLVVLNKTDAVVSEESNPVRVGAVSQKDGNEVEQSSKPQ